MLNGHLHLATGQVLDSGQWAFTKVTETFGVIPIKE
jgi:hypothetical protein